MLFIRLVGFIILWKYSRVIIPFCNLSLSLIPTQELTHIIEPDSNLVIEIVKDWDDHSQENLRDIAEELDVLTISNEDVNPLLEKYLNQQSRQIIPNLKLQNKKAGEKDREKRDENDGGCHEVSGQL